MPPQSNHIHNSQQLVELNCYKNNNSTTERVCLTTQDNITNHTILTEYFSENSILSRKFFKILLYAGKSCFENFLIKSNYNEILNMVCGKYNTGNGEIVTRNFEEKNSNQLTQNWKYETFSPDCYKVENICKLLLNSERIFKSKCETNENEDSVFGNVVFGNENEFNDSSTNSTGFNFSDEFDNLNDKLIITLNKIYLLLQNIDNTLATLKPLVVKQRRPKIFKNNFQFNYKFTNQLVHKWTISNFAYFLNDSSFMYLESIKETIISTDGNRFQVYFCLHHQNCDIQNGSNELNVDVYYGNGENDGKDISLWINFSENLCREAKNTETHLLFKASIMDCNGVLHCTKVFQVYCDQNLIKIGCEQFVSFDYFEKSKNVLLNDDKLTMIFEIDTIEYRNENLEDESTNAVTDIENYDNNDKSISVYHPSYVEELPKSVHTTTYMIKHQHTWTLRNFQKYLYEHLTVDEIGQDHLRSNSFSPLICDDIKFKLHLSTSRNDSDSNVDQISVFLSYENEQNPCGNLVQFRVSLIDRTQQKCNSKKSMVKYDFKNDKYGLENYIQTDYLFENAEQLLENDELTIVCELFIFVNCFNQENNLIQMNNQYAIGDFKSQWESKRLRDCTSESKSHTVLPVYHCAHQWTIGEFSQLQNPNPFRPFYIDFPKFKPSDYDKIYFTLRLYPKNDKLLKMCVFVDSKEISDAIVLFDLSLLAPKKVKTNTKVGRIKISNGNRIEWSNFEIDRTDIFDPKNELLNDDELVIYCKAKICLNPITESVEYPDIRILNELSHYFDIKQTSDVTLHFANGSKLYCHKEILMMQSPVFEAMFSHDFKENLTNHVTFDDKDDCSEVFQELLCYFYTGKIHKLEQFALEFIAIADKFLLHELKNFVVNWLMENITIDTMIHMLIYADIYEAPKLKLATKRFIHRNANQLVHSQLFQKLSRERPHLLLELYFDSVLGDNKNIA